MTWNYKQEEQKWLKTEAGRFLKDNQIIILRVHNIIMRYFIFQSNLYPSAGRHPVWFMNGTIEELELIARDERPINGIGDLGRKNLQEVLSEKTTLKGEDCD